MVQLIVFVVLLIIIIGVLVVKWQLVEDDVSNLRWELNLSKRTLDELAKQRDKLNELYKKGPIQQEQKMSEVNQFKAGDVVQCINSQDQEKSVINGQLYTVQAAFIDTKLNVPVIQLINVDHTGLRETRFKLSNGFLLGNEVFFITIQQDVALFSDITNLNRRKEIKLTIDESKGIVIATDSQSLTIKVPVFDNFDIIVVPMKNCFKSQEDVDKFTKELVKV
jgi:hypothetical protein